MDTCSSLIDEECAEILVNTEEVEPRGTFAENEQHNMTSFETLVHTALALEEDPRDEHSYAYSDKKVSQESMDKDHCYYSGRKLQSHRKVQSLSDEDLFTSTQSHIFGDKHFILPHYRSNDSALDVTGFDTISDKCLSFENIHVKTVDVCTESCILPGVSDPDLSRMSIQSRADVETSFSLPNSPPISGKSVTDHSYSHKVTATVEQNKLTLLKDHAYNNYSIRKLRGRAQEFLLDHSYGNQTRRDILPASVGVKRGRSNDDLSLLGSCSFKRKDFKKSPFLDHTYESVELQKSHATQKQLSKQNKTVEMIESRDNKREDESNSFTPKAIKISESNNKIVYAIKPILFHNQSLMDHTYEEITDSTADFPLTDFMRRAQRPSTCGLAHIFSEPVTDQSDHSYVINKELDDFSSTCSSSESDSGTESLNEDEEEELSALLNKCVNPHKEHPYFKSGRMKKESSDGN